MQAKTSSGLQPCRQTFTARGARLSQHGVVLSEVLRRPGPTHSVADVLAASMDCLAPGPRCAVLGFAGGGLLAPLRALGNPAVVESVDLDPRGYRLFRQLCGSWAGQVRFARADALHWLGSRARRYDVVVDDLSVAAAGDVIKPDISWVELPGLIRNRLAPGGVAVLNWLPPTHASWRAATRTVRAFYPQVAVVLLEDFENRILLAAGQLPAPRQLSAALRGALRRLGSRLEGRFAVRSVVA
jgi:hypothetical protein